MMNNSPTLIIGLGNPILGDDGIGWVIAEQLKKQYPSNPNLEFDFLSLGGFSLMERMVGYYKVIIFDAIASGIHPNGEVVSFSLDKLPSYSSGHTSSSHDTDLRTALTVGRTMDIELPQEENILIFGIETGNIYDFSEEISPEVSKSIPRVLELARRAIED